MTWSISGKHRNYAIWLSKHHFYLFLLSVIYRINLKNNLDSSLEKVYEEMQTFEVYKCPPHGKNKFGQCDCVNVG